MKRSNLNVNFLSKEERQKAVNDIISYFANERDEEIGVIAAEEMLDRFLEIVGKSLYNQGIENSKQVIRTRMEDLAVDLESLKRTE